MLFLPISRSPVATTLSHRRSPVDRSRHRSNNRLDSSGDETKTRSPKMTGVPPLLPGSGAVHKTPSVLLHVVGRFVSEVDPLKNGPRHCGQAAAESVGGSERKANDTTHMEIRA